jgi:hypothetical protein
MRCGLRAAVESDHGRYNHQLPDCQPVHYQPGVYLSRKQLVRPTAAQRILVTNACETAAARLCACSGQGRAYWALTWTTDGLRLSSSTWHVSLRLCVRPRPQSCCRMMEGSHYFCSRWASKLMRRLADAPACTIILRSSSRTAPHRTQQVPTCTAAATEANHGCAAPAGADQAHPRA